MIAIYQKHYKFFSLKYIFISNTYFNNLCQKFCFQKSNTQCAFEIRCKEICFVNIYIFPAIFELHNRIKIISSRLLLFNYRTHLWYGIFHQSINQPKICIFGQRPVSSMLIFQLQPIFTHVRIFQLIRIWFSITMWTAR